jgi:hypothetical protein
MHIIFLVFIGFYRVLSGFIGFYRVLSGFIGFYRVLFMIFKQLQQQQPLRSGAS